ncbi:MAG: exodeoxyribonuclease V subunit alpha [Gemmatimonadaceae bacterium]|nr:exodeoxyribonuclease V subunit alpha [Gemmatimonadaceae bacterium]
MSTHNPVAIAVSPLDEAFARYVERLVLQHSHSASIAELLRCTALLTSAERAQGHSCVELPVYAERTIVLGETSFAAPGLENWESLLRQSGVCTSTYSAGTADDRAPSLFVLHDSRLYLARYFAAESRVATAIRTRVAQVAPVSAPDLEVQFAALFPKAATQEDWQAIATQAALDRSLTFITGGPGTGKTTVAARILALLLHADPSLTVAIAAPTGRAAARLVESIGAAAEREQLSDAVRRQLPTTGATLHRLLGYQPWTETFRYGPGNALPHDVIVIDEASMVDILMMDALFSALRPDARVVILGDPDQLASVDTGFVLGDVVRAAHAAPATAPLAQSVVRLRHSWRFGSQPGIGALASALQQGAVNEARDVLTDATYDDVSMESWSAAALQRSIEEPLDTLLRTQTPVEALDALARFRVLAATREGPRGVQGVNLLIERMLARRGLAHTGWYAHRPVLITANDPATNLFNGDVGVVFQDDTRMSVHFLQPDGSVRALAPSRLPAHETAWAMTIHKSQGSEFDQVLLVMPEQDVPILTRELLYTGVTRAKRRVTLFGDHAILATGVQRTVGRTSGLVNQLLAPSTATG